MSIKIQKKFLEDSAGAYKQFIIGKLCR